MKHNRLHADTVKCQRAIAKAKRARCGEEVVVDPPYSVNILVKPKGWIVPVVSGTGDQKVKGREETTMTHKVELAFSFTFDKSHHRVTDLNRYVDERISDSVTGKHA